MLPRLLIAGLVTVFSAQVRAEAPKDCPPAGLCLPMDYVRTRDADTIEARLRGSAFIFAIRLEETWGPELLDADPQRREVARKGKEWVKQFCEANPHLIVFVTFQGLQQPLKRLSFDRVPAWVFVMPDASDTLNEMVVRNGFASSTRNGRLGE